MKEKDKMKEILNSIMALSLPLCKHDDDNVANRSQAINKLACEIYLALDRPKQDSDK